MAKDKVKHNKIEYFGIATYKDVNDTVGFNSFTGDTSQCLSDNVANTKNYIRYPGKPLYTGKLLAFNNLTLLNTITLTIKTNNTYGIKFNGITIRYQRKTNNQLITAKEETVFAGAILDNDPSLSVDILSPHSNDMAIYGELGVPATEKIMTIEISTSIIYGSFGSATVWWDTDTYTDPDPNNKHGKKLGEIANNQPPLSYEFDLAWFNPVLLPELKPVYNDLLNPMATKCTIMFDCV